MNLGKYIKSFRLRTLPLSMSGIILGSCMAAPVWHTDVFVLALLTTLSLQILTNLSNELGDANRGTDTCQEGRTAYGLQSGTITKVEITRCIWFFIFASAVLGTSLIYCAFGTLFCTKSLVFLILGAAAIVAAITYTLGRNPYGYNGWGDLSVFIFFGLLSTMGAYYVQAQTITLQVILAAGAIGLPIVGVLNVNNIRDMENDVIHHKITFASRLGTRKAKIYHTLLITTSFILFAFAQLWIAFSFTPLFAVHLFMVWKSEGKTLDKQMPLLSFSTLALAICCGISIFISHA